MAIERNKRPAISKITDLDIIKPERILLDNGIPVSVIRMGDTAVNRLDLIFEGGRCDEKKPMVSDLVAALVREGAGNRIAAEIAECLDYYGSWMGCEASSHNVTMSIYSLNKYFGDVIPVFADIAVAPLFPEKEIENMKNVAVTRLKDNCRKVAYLASSEFQKQYYGETHNLGKRPDEAAIRGVSRDDLVAFHKEKMHPANANIVISGMVDDRVLDSVNRTIGQIPAMSLPSRSASDKPAKEFCPAEILVEKKDAVQSCVKIGLPAVLRTHPDYIPLRILVTAFGGYFGSRLMQNIREEKGYTYGISAMLIGMRDNSCITVSSQCATAYTEKVIEEIRNEMDKLRAEPIGSEELERVKSYMRGDLAKTTDTPFSLSDYYCAAITNSIPDDYFHNQSAAVDSITPEMLQKMAAKYLDSGRMLTVVAGSLK